MNYDEFAFFNQQLAAMLRDGIPLEGALHQLCKDMRQGKLKSELELLAVDLKNGVPLRQAIAIRRLPEFYVQMMQVAAQSGDLSGVLLMLADYYQRADSIWTRVKGLLVYPLLVLAAAFALSSLITAIGMHVISTESWALFGARVPVGIVVNLWVPPILTGLLIIAAFLVAIMPDWRRGLRWRLPGFREAKLSQTASAMAMILKQGGNLNDGLNLIRQLETGTIAGWELMQWQNRLKAGHGKFSEMAQPGKSFPPLFIWLVSNAGEDMVGGFRQAAEIYGTRALQRTEMLLYTALPFSIIALGVMIVGQVFPLIRIFTTTMGAIDGGN